ncbi:MAG: efflux RND transporter periplasmic adaptor subunit [Myxococcaceae bacterium]|nr:efflux RND transporter periplasmic adaptor subunit [Myxococcaceae bacterium]
MKKRGTVVLALVAGVALVVGGALWLKNRSSEPELRFETATVDRGRVVARVSATGTLSALVTVQVGSQVSGRIASLHADFNSQVKKGDVLATIDPQLFEAALEQARANAAAAQGNLTRAKVQAQDAQRVLQRTRALAEQKLISAADLDTALANAQAAEAQVEVAQSAVSQAKASLHQAEVNLQYTTIHSPIDGVVISRNVDVGQTVAASLQAPTLFVIAEDLRKMQVDTSVSEADVGKLTPGMKAIFTVDAYPELRFEGTVRQIRNAPTTVQNVVTYDAVIDVENPELRLKPGMTANVTFIYAERKDVLRVPNAALRFRPPPELSAKAGPVRPANAQGSSSPERSSRRAPDQKTLWVLRADGRPEPVTVTTGTTDGSQTEIVAGDVKEGDRVITDVVGGTEPASASPGRPPRGMRRMF